MVVHAERYSTTGVLTHKRGLVFHTSESGDGTYQSLINFMAMPGDRPLAGTTRKIGASYHAIAKNNSGAEYDQVLPSTAGPYSAPPLNKTHWHFCFPGRAAQTRSEWLDDMSREGIRAGAKFAVTRAAIDGFPLVRLTVAELAAGQLGYCDHGTVSKAFGQSNHTDVGPNFPWDVLAADIAELSVPPPVPHPQPEPPPIEEDDMPRKMVIVGNDDNHSDPHRWLWDVNRLTLLLENETNEIDLIWPDTIDDRWTLQAPFWKPNDWIRTKVT